MAGERVGEEMTYNPYDDFEDTYDEATSLPEAHSASLSNPPGPQPVTDASNPFAKSSYPSYGAAPDYNSSYQASAGGYQQNPFMPTISGYHAPPPEVQRHMSNLKLNAWLSAFFPFVSIIFFFVDKGKSRLYDDHLRETMNMGLTRMLLWLGTVVFSGGFSALFAFVSFVYFILALIGASQSTQRFLQGQPSKYKGAIPFTRR